MRRGILFVGLAAAVALLLWALAVQIHGRGDDLAARRAFPGSEAGAAQRNAAAVRDPVLRAWNAPVAFYAVTVNLAAPDAAAPMLTGEGFDFALFSAMPQSENFVFSPLSLKLALALAAEGAGGQNLNRNSDRAGG